MRPLGGKQSPFYQRNFRFYCFSFSGRAYLHRQKEERNRCRLSRIYSLGFGLTLCWRICSECCAACAGPSRRSRGLRSCTPLSCTAEPRTAVPGTQSSSHSTSGEFPAACRAPQSCDTCYVPDAEWAGPESHPWNTDLADCHLTQTQYNSEIIRINFLRFLYPSGLDNWNPCTGNFAYDFFTKAQIVRCLLPFHEILF